MIEEKERHIIDIADYIYANPNKRKTDIVAIFCRKLHKKERTVWTYVKKANIYNSNRIKKKEEIRDKALEEDAKKSIKNTILSRNEALEILTLIAKGSARRINGEILVPTDSDRRGAIRDIAKLEGWDIDDSKTKKHDITISYYNSSEKE